MKSIIRITVLLLIALTSLTAYGQRTVSLRQYEAMRQAYRNSPDPIAAGLDEGEDITYAKDVNNELNPFVGTWKGTYNNRSYEFNFTKKTAYKFEPSDKISFDLLKGLVTVKDSVGNMLYTNTTKQEELKGFTGDTFQGNTGIYRLDFTGNCSNETGTVFIYIKQDGKMSLSFAISQDLKGNDCPNGFTPVLPISPNNVLLTKQP